LKGKSLTEVIIHATQTDNFKDWYWVFKIVAENEEYINSFDTELPVSQYGACEASGGGHRVASDVCTDCLKPF